MAETAKTTLRPISLGFRAVGSEDSVAYTPCMGVLKGLTVAQDTPDSTEIEAQFYDTPFDIVYDGKPLTFTFELANYKLSDLPKLFGGTYQAADASNDESYEAPSNVTTNEFEWKLGYSKGNKALVISKGLTMATVKQDDGGALNFSVTITALTYTDGDGVDHLYKIVGDPKTGG